MSSPTVCLPVSYTHLDVYKRQICKIRSGTQSGTKIRLKGKGIVSMKDPNVHGDMYVTVQVKVPVNLSPEAKQKLHDFEALALTQGCL